MAWARNGTPHTLSSSADDLQISDLTALKFNQILYHTIDDGGTAHGARLILDGTEANDYAERLSYNGGADSTNVSQDDIQWWADNTADDHFGVGYIINIDSEEKLFIGFVMAQGAAGAATAPYRRELVGKKDTSTDTGQFTDIKLTNENSGLSDFDTGSNLSALGTD